MAKGGAAISLEGAEKVLAEFHQSEKALGYYIFIDSGKKRNLIKLGCAYVLVISLAGAFFLTDRIFTLLFGALSFLSLAIFALTLRKLLKDGRENFPKEKLFLTEKNIIVQHSLQERRIKYVPIERYKKIERKKTPFGELATLVYLDGEGLSELREKLYFPANPDLLAESISERLEQVQKAEAAGKKKE